MVILAIDVYYKNESAKAVGVLFSTWEDDKSLHEIIERLDNIEEYEPGKFYKRELPCVLKIIEKVDLKSIETIVIDGYVYVNDDRDYGLGGMLWDKLGGKVSVIGVAKTSFYANQGTIVQVKRGQSNSPLYVSAIGMDVKQAAELIQNMKGNYRVPDILKDLDHRTKHD
jgi:deoxyribonuclease V